MDIGRLGAKSRTSQAPVRAGIGWGAGTAGRLGGTVGRAAQRATVRRGVARRGDAVQGQRGGHQDGIGIYIGDRSLRMGIVLEKINTSALYSTA